MDLIDREKALGCFWVYEDGDETEMPAYDRLQALPIVAEVEDCISRQGAVDALDKIFPADPMRNDYTQGITCGAALAEEYIKQLPSAQPEVKEIGYVECADAMLKMWMDNVLTDGEYNRIMDKLNKYWGKVNA